MSDKPEQIASIRRLSSGEMAYARHLFRRRLIALKSVDDMIGRLLTTLKQNQQYNRTYIILTSDNGFQLGNHRLIGKQDPYDETTRVPLLVWGPGVPSSRRAHHLVAHIDLAPTILELAQVQIPSFVDGKSFVEIMKRPRSTPPREWRDAILVENWERVGRGGASVNMAYTMLRMYDATYVEWADGGREYYNLNNDANQLNNSYAQLSEEEQLFFERYIRLMKTPNTTPLTTITNPFDNNAYVCQPVTLRGMAEDDERVVRVRLVIRDRATGKYWNGGGWVRSRAEVSATLRNQGGQLTEWSYHFDPVLAAGNPGRFWFSARAYDHDGQFTVNVPARNFEFDPLRPETTITRPENGALSGRRLRIAGEATDNIKVEEVRLYIRRSGNNRYWNGSEWQVGRAYVTAHLQGGGFSYAFNAPNGNYTVLARAYDCAGNWDSSPASTFVRVR